jgi:UDP-N-acetylglucosamine--N-acetylmuramyl-(pentapeptide) pyrophosphoryl-undecaprenol N-acetylglucosamine transferase
MAIDGKRTLMVAGGGTGGHIYPALAIAQEWVSRESDRTAVFVGTEYGLEKKIVPKSGFPLEFVAVGGLKGKSIIDTIRNLLKLPLGFVGAWKLISRYRPVAILGVGGYASGPVLLVGALRGYPTLVHEQNAYPGLTNRLLARVVRQLAVAYPEALERFRRKGVVTGNPIRHEFFTTTAPPRIGNKVRLLLFGGSQGSRILNRTMGEALLFLAHLKDQLEIVHQTGQHDLEMVRSAYEASAFSDARITPYLDSMASEIAAADLVVSRAGAMTAGELCAVGRAAILVPFAAATNDHQFANAKVLAATGGARIIVESELTPEKLAGAISEIASDREKAKRMGEQLRPLASPEASARVSELLEAIERK